MDLRETGWSVTDWINLAEDRDQWGALVDMVMDIWAPTIFGVIL
jgi:hypothetical protein